MQVHFTIKIVYLISFNLVVRLMLMNYCFDRYDLKIFFLWKVIGDQTARIIVYSIIWIASYCKIYRHVDLNWIFFWLKFVLRFFSNKFRLVFYTKLLGYLIEPNEKTCSWLFFPYKIWTTNLTLYFHICKYLFYTMNKVLNDNIITFIFVIIVISLRNIFSILWIKY